jgi:transcriptional regulator PpsR
MTLKGLNAEDAATLITAASDVALIVDGDGIIRDVAFGSDELSREGYAKWLGQPWIDTVTVESRPKVEALLRDAVSNVTSKGRHINHTSARGADVPVLYSAVRVGATDRIVAVGRDLRAIAALQHRLVEAQQSMERDYWRLRQVETRYRLLFQTASEAVLIVDALTDKVVEANPAAIELLGDSVARVVGKAFVECFASPSTSAITALVSAVRASGKADETDVRVAGSRREFSVNVSMFRQDKSTFFLVRITAKGDAPARALPKEQSYLLKLIEIAPDAFVVTDPEGQILTANAAFADLAQIVNEDQARGESIERWLGRPGVDLAVLIANLRQHGAVRLFATTVRGDSGGVMDVEISAVSVATGEQPCLGFAIRSVGRRLAADIKVSQDLPRSVQQLTELVGRVPLKDIVRDTTDLIERLCIEAALELTRDNRASAAEMLGVSRQSLYVKLHRYGLGDLTPDSDE